jgi:hypothetical protein
MRAITPGLLWIGNALEARDVRSVPSLGVKAVVDLAANELPIQYPRDIAYGRFPLIDGQGNDAALLRLAVMTTVELVKSSVPTLVACSARMSRSPAIISAAVAIDEKSDPDEVLLRIASAGPHDIAPALWSEIKRVLFSP